ncbi:endo-1,4-beta-xylanase [Mucilaginibacter daejeonensis]|uniref:endo-1,4-beta-xylanase n=1 Tax=Mucilaginibacter daejeonensis TaxID=398049 RepID=UPI001D170346|nr:endo-1,4-beta-xylanase [Mucilaginibacter daejeonensis]UEG54813.1 endo-1,4-beta-xylanase [Mucilaginibacter daejeonensis]
MKKNILLVAILSSSMVCACSKHGATTDPNPQPPVVTSPPVTTEGSLRTAMPFPFGAAVNISLLKSNASYRAVVVKEFNSLTAENAMKASALHPQQTTFDWTDADYLVDFARQNDKRIHGHTLIWYKSLPSWITNFQGDAAAWESVFKTHIQTIVSHFKGKVTSWDVVNEAFEDDGTLRNSIWLQKLGNDYIARAFQYAHEADPDAQLFYNDYGNEYGPTKRTAILNLVNNLKSRGIPINGIGMQMHTRYNMTESNWTTAINTAAQTGLKVHISELDIAMNPDNDQNLTFTAALANTQAQKYLYIVKAYNAIPKAQQFGITTWNVSDADTWITGNYNRPDWPLPFDKNYNRKPAYQGILDGVK